MIRGPPRSTLDRSSAASDVYKRQAKDHLRRDLREAKQDFKGTVTKWLTKAFESLVNLEKSAGVLAVDIPKILEQATGNPVSYTHLRAHETVLDLVCRLLLEKTKQQKKKTKQHKKKTNKTNQQQPN